MNAQINDLTQTLFVLQLSPVIEISSSKVFPKTFNINKISSLCEYVLLGFSPSENEDQLSAMHRNSTYSYDDLSLFRKVAKRAG